MRIKVFMFTLKQQMEHMLHIMMRVFSLLAPIFVMHLSNMKEGKLREKDLFEFGLKMPIGWIYAEGITHFEVDSTGRLLLAGHDYQGRLAVCLEIESDSV